MPTSSITQVYYAASEDGGQTWARMRLSPAPSIYEWVSTQPDVTADSNGNMAAVWKSSRWMSIDSLGGNIYVTTTQTPTLTLISEGDYGANWPRITAAPDGQLHVIWYYGDNQIHYRRWDGTAWLNITTISAGTAAFPEANIVVNRHDIIVNDQGQVFAAWSGDQHTFLATSNGQGTWFAPIALAHDWVASGLALAMDEAGTPIGLDRKSTNIYELKVVGPTKHYYAAGQRIATRVGDELYYILGDHLGSTTVVADAQGNEVGRALYDPYGEMVESTMPAYLTDQLFTGQTFDAASGLYYYNARYYDPFTGGFTQMDSLVAAPLDPRAWNRSGYVYGNPANFTDSSGHFIDTLWDAVDLAVDV